jgi:hypothetical protein
VTHRKLFTLVFAGALMALASAPARAQGYPPPGYPPPVYPPPGFYGVASLRLQVTPREAQVFVDGYEAGIVNNFNGVFHRLRVAPGQQELVIYLPGYRTYRENLYLNPGSSRNIRFTMIPLAPGESVEPPPVPSGPAVQTEGRGAPLPRVEPSTARASQVGTFSVGVQPSDASVFIDGEPWHGSEQQDRLLVQLPQGTHHLQVEKAGFQTFVVDFEVRAGQTTSLNVNLLNAR